MSSSHVSESGSAALSAPQAGQQWDARLWGALVVLCGVLFLDGLDVSMVGVALPSIGADLDLSTSALQWVVSGYVLGYGGLLLLGGRFADLLGRRRVLLAALAVFTAASIVGGLVDDGTLLVITRFLKGAAAAFTAPASLSIITTTFAEGPARNRALAIYTACGASGFSLGLVFGGLLTELGWRWTFLLPVPIAIALLVAAPRVLAKDAPAEGPRRGFDFAGAATITAAMLLLVRTVVEAPEAGWGAPRRSAASPSRRCCSRPSSRSSSARPIRSCGSASCARARSSGPTWAWRPCSARTWHSSSSARCTCSRCWAGRRSRPRSRSCRAACSWRSAHRGSARSWIATAPPGSSWSARSRS